MMQVRKIQKVEEEEKQLKRERGDRRAAELFTKGGWDDTSTFMQQQNVASTIHGKDKYKFVVGKSNNCSLIRHILLTRASWVERCKGLNFYNFDFMWKPTAEMINFSSLYRHGGRNLVNHFENHRNLSSKD